MFKSVRIQNFRQFRDLKLDGLAQINLITGANDTGKTSLLEALYIHVAAAVDPEVIRTIARLRGMGQVGVTGRSAWGWIFNAGSSTDEVTITAKNPGGEAETTTLTVSTSSLRRPNGTSHVGTSLEDVTISTEETSGPSLEILHTDPSGDQHAAFLDVVDRDIVPRPADGVPGRRWYFLSTRGGHPEREAFNYDQLVLAGQESRAIAAMKIVDDRIMRARTLNPGTGPGIYIDTGDGILLPASVLGQGTTRIWKMVTAVLTSNDGTVLIDEVEDGLHYSVLPSVWKAIIETALKHNVQVFATTHSWECIAAAVKASEDHQGSLALFRLERHKNDIRAIDVKDEGVRAAVDFSLELR